MRAAVVPSNATKDALMLDAHAEAYATAGSVRVTVDRAKDPDVGIVAFDWQVAYLGSSIPRDELEPALLMLALPHHVDASWLTKDRFPGHPTVQRRPQGHL